MKKLIKKVLSFFRFIFFRIASIFIIKNNKDIFVQKYFKNLNNYIREDYILEKCKNKNVLYFLAKQAFVHQELPKMVYCF